MAGRWQGIYVLAVAAAMTGCDRAQVWEPSASPSRPVVPAQEPVVTQPEPAAPRPEPLPEPDPEPSAHPKNVCLPTVAVGDHFAKWMIVRGQTGVAFHCKLRVHSNPDQLPIIAELKAGNGDTLPVDLRVRGPDEAVVDHFIPNAGPAGRPYSVQVYAVTGPGVREPLGQERELQWIVAR